MRSGISGIEKSMAAKSKLRDTEISKAFQDLDKLMEMAKPMVSLAKSISGKIRVSDEMFILLFFETLTFRPECQGSLTE